MHAITQSNMLPSDEIAMNATIQASHTLTDFIASDTGMERIELIGLEGKRDIVELPTFALRLLGKIMTELAIGNAVTVVPTSAELTTQKAADILNVSRPYLVKLLDEGALPHTRTGSHRRIRFADVMAYKERRDQASLAVMAELSAEAQELRMGYE